MSQSHQSLIQHGNRKFHNIKANALDNQKIDQSSLSYGHHDALQNMDWSVAKDSEKQHNGIRILKEGGATCGN
jgi:hypothetical protein